MDKVFNYAGLFDQALGRIKALRDPHATRPETTDLRWKDVASQVLFDFGGKDLRKYHQVSKAANEISISCLCFMVVKLLELYEYPFEQITVDKPEGLLNAELYIIDKKTDTLLLFKELENDFLWKEKDFEPPQIQAVMDQNKAKDCKYIYFVRDCAYLQIIGHNDDESDPGRGYNFYSIRWFFETYFGIDEYKNFEKALNKYIRDIEYCIGYSTIKTLTPGSLINFRKVTENEILNYPYAELIDKHVKTYTLDADELEKLKKQFVEEKTYTGLLGSNDYAESLATAEWLYDSMKKAKAIDLTVIGMGYFKAIEQILFEIICLHKKEGRQIKKDYSRKDLPQNIELNDDNIADEAIDTTIGAMAVFYKHNSDMFNNDITDKTRRYILETIFEYKDLRNGYFHKHNIHDWNKIETIRNSTFELLFLLLGAIVLTKEQKAELGYPEEIITDYYKLCEYVSYHNQELFYLDFGEDSEVLAIGCYDTGSRVLKDKHIGYTGVFFRPLGEKSKTFGVLPDALPSKISLGKFVFDYTDKIEIKPVKVKTIYENGKFVGPSIAEEEKLDY